MLIKALTTLNCIISKSNYATITITALKERTVKVAVYIDKIEVFEYKSALTTT